MSDEAFYMERYERTISANSRGGGLQEYDTLEEVAGAAFGEPIKSQHAATISTLSLRTARDYVKDRNTSSLIIWRDGVIEEETYFGDVSQDSLIASKALAKPITAIVVGLAIQQGYIKSLEQPVADFITEWQGDPMREAILIRHLLDMRTGFLPQGIPEGPDDILYRAYLHPRHDEIIINDYPIVAMPGSIYGYSNATSELVAPVIERATGKRYSEFLSQELLRPLGAKGGSIWVNRPGGMAHSGCCLLLPARSFLKMAVLLIQDGKWTNKRLLPEGYVAQMREGSAEHPYYGLGLWLPHKYIERRGFLHPSIEFGKVLHSEPYLDEDIFLFDGNGNQVVYMIPSSNMIIMRLGGFGPQGAPEWDNSYLPNLLIRDAFRDNEGQMPLPQER